jgi:hypothetical protein
MSTQYNGLPTNVTPSSAINIASSTNATPPQITTSSAHGYSTGDRVFIQNHTDGASHFFYNGLWQIVVTGATTFTLVGGVASGFAGNTSGTVTNQGFQAAGSSNGDSSYAIPSDGDKRSAASVNVALQHLGDCTRWLKSRVGIYVPVQVGTAGNEDLTNTSYWSSSTTAGTFTLVTGVTLTLANAAVAGDLIEGAIIFQALGNGTVAGGDFEARYNENSGTDTRVANSRLRTSQPAASGNLLVPMVLPFQRTVGTTGAWKVTLYGATVTAANSIQAAGDWQIIARHWRLAST